MCPLLNWGWKGYLGRGHLIQGHSHSCSLPSAWRGPSATSSAPSSWYLDSSPFSPPLQPSSHMGPTSSQTTTQGKWVRETYLQPFPPGTRRILILWDTQHLIFHGLFHSRKYVSLQTEINRLQSEFSSSLHGIFWVVLSYVFLQVIYSTIVNLHDQNN